MKYYVVDIFYISRVLSNNLEYITAAINYEYVHTIVVNSIWQIYTKPLAYSIPSSYLHVSSRLFSKHLKQTSCF